MGAAVGAAVGARVGAAVGAWVGAAVGAAVANGEGVARAAMAAGAVINIATTMMAMKTSRGLVHPMRIQRFDSGFTSGPRA